MMALHYLLGNSINRLINSLPMELKYKVKLHFVHQDMEWCMYRLRLNGFMPQAVIDVGAYRGEWASVCKRIFPESAILMIEPQGSENSFLKYFCKRYPECQYRNALVGAEEKEIAFSIEPSKVRSRVSQAETEESIHRLEKTAVKSVVTLDSLIKETPFERAQLLKLDVQGYELEVLKGAKSLLNSTEVILMEITVAPEFIPGGPLIYEVFEFMRSLHYRLLDFYPLLRQPEDGALCQIDAFFAKESSQLGRLRAVWD